MKKQGWLTASLIGLGGALLVVSIWTTGPDPVQNRLRRSSRSALKKPDRRGQPSHLANSRKGRRAGCIFLPGTGNRVT
jgi:hypothetical protein